MVDSTVSSGNFSVPPPRCPMLKAVTLKGPFPHAASLVLSGPLVMLLMM
jgi:hypothetical protein